MNALSSERRILTYGTFDRFHVHHVRYLKRLAGMGERLIVGLSTHDLALQNGNTPVLSYEERREVLLSCQYVDRVIAHEHLDQVRTDIVNYNISLFAMPDKWAGQFDHLNDLAQVLYLPTAPVQTPAPSAQAAEITPFLRHA